MGNLYAEHARELLGVGPDWQVSSWRSMDWKKLGFDHPAGRVKITGSCAPMLPDGRVCWEFEDKATRKSVLIRHDIHHAWVMAWEQRTGTCSACYSPVHPHPGLENMGWSAEKGTILVTCRRCKGTGKAPEVVNG